MVPSAEDVLATGLDLARTERILPSVLANYFLAR